VNILLVEVEMLEELGCRCAARHTADEAFAVVRSRPIDLALIDVNLGSGVDGLTLARGLQTTFGIRTVFITGNATPELKAQVEHLNAALLEKPVYLDSLRDALNSMGLSKRV
jgi:DNA-binding NtrC family response regulator